MDAPTAAFWLDAIAAGAVTAWAAGFLFIHRTAARTEPPLTGTADVPGSPRQLATRLAAALVRGIAGSSLRIEQQNDSRIAWSCAAAPSRHCGEVRLVATGSDRTTITWTVATSQGLLRAARWVAGAGAVLVIGLYLLLRTLAVPSDDPGVRGQTIQMVQAVHLLWPPFLLAGLARQLRTRLGYAIDTMVGNLPYEAGS